jgi:hypothetical protein
LPNYIFRAIGLTKCKFEGNKVRLDLDLNL